MVLVVAVMKVSRLNQTIPEPCAGSRSAPKFLEPHVLSFGQQLRQPSVARTLRRPDTACVQPPALPRAGPSVQRLPKIRRYKFLTISSLSKTG